MNLNIEPKDVFKWFYEINQIPRCSGKEKAVSDFLVNFAKERSLDVVQDEALNVIIKKPATKGHEKAKKVIIQGHMDMVCVKDEDSDHNFDTDPIEMYVDGDFLKAKGTTLGADDGIAVAMALAILDSDEIEHPTLEVLVTTSEETNMGGAAKLKKGLVTGDILLNIDSEEEGDFLVSCSGGASVKSTFKIEKENNNKKALKITIKGLLGGHSGSEIDRQRANAITLLGRILNELRKNDDIRITEIMGGIKHNAIPSKAEVKVAVSDMEKAVKTVEDFSLKLKEEFRVEEKGMEIISENTEASDVYTKDLTNRIIDYLMTCPNGVISMSKDIEGLVETSLNNAIIFENNGNVENIISIRSSSVSQLEYIIDKLNVIAKNYKASYEITDQYPAWEFESNSVIRDMSLEFFEKMFNKKARTTAIHAGLECGLLKGVLPNCDMISYGPDIFDAHTPKERISISSTKRMYEFTKEILKNIK